MVVLSHKVFARDGRPNPVHSFDAGAAFENLALQGAAMGLVVHGMAGFDRGKARATLGVPDDYEIEAMVAVGHPGAPAALPPQLQARDALGPKCGRGVHPRGQVLILRKGRRRLGPPAPIDRPTMAAVRFAPPRTPPEGFIGFG